MVTAAGTYQGQVDAALDRQARQAAAAERAREVLARAGAPYVPASAEPMSLADAIAYADAAGERREREERQREAEERQRQAEAEAARRAEEAVRRAHARAPTPTAPPAATPSHYVTSKRFVAYCENLEKALGMLFRRERQAAVWRMVEAERRLAELEARVAQLEGQSRG